MNNYVISCLNVQLKNASRAAAVGTASMGKFDKRAKGEEPSTSHLGIKRRKFEPVVGNTGKETEKVIYAFFSLLPMQSRFLPFIAYIYIPFGIVTDQCGKPLKCLPTKIRYECRPVGMSSHECMAAASILQTRLC